MAIFRGGSVRLLVCFVLVPSSAAFRTLPTRRGGTPAMTLDDISTWSDLETRLPSCASIEMPTFDADTVDPAALEGATVLFADRNRWCPNSERVWLALELKRARYITVLVDDDYSATPGEDGCLPRVQWPDGTTNDGSGIRAILERIETEHPHEPNFFPRISVTVAVVRDDVERRRPKASAHSPSSTPSSLSPPQRQIKFRAASSLGLPRLIGRLTLTLTMFCSGLPAAPDRRPNGPDRLCSARRCETRSTVSTRSCHGKP